jgi:hypothetical protein
MDCSVNTSSEKVVRTVREFCQKNRETGAWPSSEHAVRAIVQQGEQSPFAPAILRYNRRVLIDQVAWDTCLARLSQPQTNVPIKEVADGRDKPIQAEKVAAPLANSNK